MTELTYRVSSEKVLNNCLRMIKELRKRVTTRQNQEKEKAGLVEQAQLVLASKGTFQLTVYFSFKYLNLFVGFVEFVGFVGFVGFVSCLIFC